MTIQQPQALSTQNTSQPSVSAKPSQSWKLLVIISIVITLIIILITSAVLIHEYLVNQRLDAESVALIDNLEIPFGEKVNVSDFLADLQGELVDDFEINTEQLGSQEITFEYINVKNRKRPSSFSITVIDNTSPKIFGATAYTVYTGYAGDLTNLMLSGDDLDDTPVREIIGEYNTETPGTYNLKYVITDASGNKTSQPFILHVIDPPENSNPEPEPESTKLPISDIIKQHKTAQTKVGIDVSQWQGEIDWKKVKDSGVEFAMLRIGYQAGFGGEYVLDPYFKSNLAGVKANNLPVGVYFYSYADSLDEATSQAAWIVDQLNGIKLELGIAFDWENWSYFNDANISFYKINKIATTFLDGVTAANYKGLLYSSKNYLERIWYPTSYQTWLAQYYDYVTYDGDYLIWQMTDSGRVPGIDGAVDVDIMYINN